MAIITISGKKGSLSEETSEHLAEILGYKFITRKMLETDLLKNGISKQMLKAYDERKPSLWASLSRNRDKYFDFLREIVFEYANQSDCVFIGRGSFAILEKITNCYFVRLVAPNHIRIQRIMKEYNCGEKQAQKILQEHDENRSGFHKFFFDVEQNDPTLYNMVLNTSGISSETASEIIKTGHLKSITSNSAEKSKTQIAHNLLSQKIVNAIAFKHGLEIFFLDVEVERNKISVFGVADSNEIISKTIDIVKQYAGGREIISEITCAGNYGPMHNGLRL